MTFTLYPIYDSRKSFYGKAQFTTEGHGEGTITRLYSYGTHVASIKFKNTSAKRAEVYGTYSSTTLRHIKEFLRQHDFEAKSKAQIEADYMRSK